jgi:hypothetical protein
MELELVQAQGPLRTSRKVVAPVTLADFFEARKPQTSLRHLCLLDRRAGHIRLRTSRCLRNVDGDCCRKHARHENRACGGG